LVLLLALAWANDTQAFIFGPKGGSEAQKKANVLAQRDGILAQLYAAKPDMKQVISNAVGYATFNQKDVNLLLLASGTGYGVAVDQKTGKETFMRMASLGGGVGLGLRDMRVIFIFHDAKVMRQFIDQGWQFGGQANAAAKYQNTGVAAQQAVKADVDFRDGTVAAGSSTDLQASQDARTKESASLASRGGMEIYQFTESGVSLQATVSGTKYWKDSRLNR
jgi:hypothetical protein